MKAASSFRSRRTPPAPGLIGAGIGLRLSGAAAAIALLWLTVFWALH